MIQYTGKAMISAPIISSAQIAHRRGVIAGERRVPEAGFVRTVMPRPPSAC